LSHLIKVYVMLCYLYTAVYKETRTTAVYNVK